MTTSMKNSVAGAGRMIEMAFTIITSTTSQPRSLPVRLLRSSSLLLVVLLLNSGQKKDEGRTKHEEHDEENLTTSCIF
jgi:hypothetical protein